LLVLRDRLPPRGIVPDCLRIDAQLKGGKPQDLAVDLQRLLMRKASEHTNKSNLVGEAESVMDPPALRNFAPVAFKEGPVADEARSGDIRI